MKPLVIYHADCADGFGAAFAAWIKLGDEAEYLPMEYGQEIVPTQIADNREVYILDFSFPRHVMEGLFALAKRVVWLDHHKTAFEMWTGLYVKDGIHIEHDYDPDSMRPWVTLDDTESGAMLAWEYFLPGTEIPKLIQHIDDRDRWQFKLDGTKEVIEALNSYKPWTFEQWWSFLAWEDFLREGKTLLRAHNQNVQACLKQVRGCVIIPAIIDSAASYKAPWVWGNGAEFGDSCFAIGLAANAPAFLASDLGHELANESGTFGLVWSMAGDGQVHCSLRSNGDYDVSAIAKAFDGGGHRNAAGFSTNIETLVEWLK